MKKFFLALSALVSLFQMHAQVTETGKSMSLGNNNAMVLFLSNTDAKTVGQVWVQYIKDYYDGKTKYMRKEKEYFTDNVQITALAGNNPIDLYAQMEERTGGVEFVLWTDLGGAFLSSSAHGQEYKDAEKILLKFSLEVAKETVRQEMAAEEKELKEAEKELEKLKSTKDRLLKEIEKAKEAIQKAEEGIVQNDKDQELTTKKIEDQKKVVDEVKKKLNDMD